MAISKKKFLSDAAARPEAFERLGAAVLRKFKAYRCPASYSRLIYFNRELARKLGYEELLADRKGREKLLRLAFDVDCEQIETADAVDVWVDAQVDPSGVGLNGNTGSGRAAYIGRHFNKKGIGRTPHAHARQDSLYGTGRSHLAASLWELICSNTIATNLSTGSSPVLSSFVLNRRFPVPGGAPEETWIATTLERVDRGALDRPTHLFVPQNSRLEQVRLEDLAARFGAHEGEKFAERILHGAWSPGNISLEGHMLDLETACAVPGRSPQHTLSSRYLTNYFGLEWKGQLRVLEQLCGDRKVNRKSVKFERLSEIFHETRRSHLEQKLMSLLGLGDAAAGAALVRYGAEASWLTSEFERLSMKMGPNLLAVDTRDSSIARPHLFDFSSLFRRYGHARQIFASTKERLTYGINILATAPPSFDAVDNPGVPDDVKAVLRDDYAVKTNEDYRPLLIEARHYVGRIEAFFDAVEREVSSSAFKAIRAYRANEDRPYLSGSYGHKFVAALADEFQSGNISCELLGRTVELLVAANDRRAKVDSAGRMNTDYRIFREAALCRKLYPDFSYQIQLSLFREKVTRRAEAARWEVRVGPDSHPLHFHSRSRLELRFVSPVLKDLSPLRPSQFIKLTMNGKWVKFNDYVDTKPRSPFALTID